MQTYEEALEIDNKIMMFFYKYIDSSFDKIIEINKDLDSDICDGCDSALKLYYYIENRAGIKDKKGAKFD